MYQKYKFVVKKLVGYIKLNEFFIVYNIKETNLVAKKLKVRKIHFKEIYCN